MICLVLERFSEGAHVLIRDVACVPRVRPTSETGTDRGDEIALPRENVRSADEVANGIWETLASVALC